MSAMEVPSLHHKTMKGIERKVGKHVRAVAKESCTEALQQERLPLYVKQETTSDQTAKGQFKYDMGWQKRGSGRSYDSKSGVGTLIGNRAGKVCAYGARIKDCKTCNYHKGKGPVPKHQCFKNWNGSSKAMEADVGGELVEEFEKENVNWCGYHQGQQSYKHKGLPYGRPLTGDSLREDMDAIFRVFIANSDKIAPGGSTKDVESFNNMVATKAPKRMYLSSSDSLLNRVACAVAQKNDGHSYINTLNNSLCMSPGRLMAERAELKRRRSAK
ncbi:uncharacterized protein LOC127878796 [Dreissena polymorpha]|uniref:uncharacterized protein LOC127878796 n=1 Tax=Dreissena polymorpha TaxID=45954 RepID=UPI0022653F98|nr:uncharacterized protein LOC127878796 [Dreissena polymorpha]